MNLRPDDAARLAGDLLDLETHHGTAPESGLVGVPASGVHSLPGGRLGNYRITRLVGTGGMGEVYEAEQENPRRRVALKVVRASLLSSDLRRRFEHEVRILGSLQHPGIAQIYEAGQFGAEGVDASTPFFAMEYVEGEPLTKYAVGRKLGVRERLELFLRVCQAVEHAHQRGIIHRDLKPANILVATPSVSDTKSGSSLTDHLGQPKVLDFGVARATDADVAVTSVHTEIGKLVGTLPYMSPEQASGDVRDLDTRSDVYALGVVLYELLSGKLPYEVKGDGGARVAQALRVIKEVDPTPLSSIDRVFRGDLETIVGKALEKERERRYQSVGELAGDIKRYLEDEPIVARRAGAWYQFRKLAARHRAFVAAGLIVMGTMAFATVLASWFAYRESVARVEAEKASGAAARRESHAVAVASFLRELLAAPNPVRHGVDVRVVDVLDEARGRIEEQFGDRPGEAARVATAIGEAYIGVGEFAKAEPMLRTAMAYWEAAEDDEPEESVPTAIHLAHAVSRLDRPLDAKAILTKAIARAEEALGPLHSVTRSAVADLGAACYDAGEYEEAEKIARRAAELAVQISGASSVEALVARGNLATPLTAQRRDEEVEQIHRECLEGFRAQGGESSAYTLTAMHNYGRFLMSRHRPAEGGPMLEAAYEGRKRVLGDDHPDTLAAMDGYGWVLRSSKRLEEADRTLQSCYERRARVHGEDALDTLATLASLARVQYDLGRFEEAEANIVRAANGTRDKLGISHKRTHDLLLDAADFCRLRSRHEDALKRYEAVHESARAAFGQSSCEDARVYLSEGECLVKLDRLDDAERAFIEAERIFDACKPANHRIVERTWRNLRDLLTKMGKAEQAREYEVRLNRAAESAKTAGDPH